MNCTSRPRRDSELAARRAASGWHRSRSDGDTYEVLLAVADRRMYRGQGPPKAAPPSPAPQRLMRPREPPRLLRSTDPPPPHACSEPSGPMRPGASERVVPVLDADTARTGRGSCHTTLPDCPTGSRRGGAGVPGRAGGARRPDRSAGAAAVLAGARAARSTGERHARTAGRARCRGFAGPSPRGPGGGHARGRRGPGRHVPVTGPSARAAPPLRRRRNRDRTAPRDDARCARTREAVGRVDGVQRPHGGRVRCTETSCARSRRCAASSSGRRSRASRRKRGPGWRGRIALHHLQEMVQDPETLCFVCGPHALVEDVPRLLQQAGVAPDRIRTEDWGS